MTLSLVRSDTGAATRFLLWIGVLLAGFALASLAGTSPAARGIAPEHGPSGTAAEAAAGRSAPVALIADSAELVGEYARPRDAVARVDALVPAAEAGDPAFLGGPTALLIAAWLLSRPGLARRLPSGDRRGAHCRAGTLFCPG